MSRRWFQIDDPTSRWSIAAVAGAVFLCGLFWQNVALLGGGAVVLCLVLRRASNPEDERSASHARSRRKSRHGESTSEDGEGHPNGARTDSAAHLLNRSNSAPAPKSTSALVEELLESSRYALLLRPAAKQHLSQRDVVRAVRQLDEAMALVPAGRVLLGQLAEQSNSPCGAADMDPKLLSRQLVSVAPVYLDRYVVTNEQFQQFVDAGGYEQLELWNEEALPALLDFVDQTGVPAPRYWHDGQYPAGEQRLPVVGVSWYEASACARWVGKQLPTDAEWTKAGAWPVESAPGRIAQRR
jgi:Sulfatase-modifying factor enzyme 1